MVFTRNPTVFYQKNNNDIIKFATSISYYKTKDEIRELVQSFYLNLLTQKSLKKFKKNSGLTFSCYIFNLVKWTAESKFNLIKKIPSVDIDNFDCSTNEDPDENLNMEENVKQYLDWVKVYYPQRLSGIKRFIKKRNKGYPTMEIGYDYNLHHMTVSEYLQSSRFD
jgi:hypothetical protein